MSPSAAVTSCGSFSASAASKYAITSCFVVRYSAASHGSIPVFPIIVCSVFFGKGSSGRAWDGGFEDRGIIVVLANRNLPMGLATVGG